MVSVNTFPQMKNKLFSSPVLANFYYMGRVTTGLLLVIVTLILLVRYGA
jgi:hypothetical protein